MKSSSPTAPDPVAPLALAPPAPMAARLAALLERWAPARAGGVLWPIGFALLLLLCWHLLVRATGVPEAIMPPPGAVLEQLLQHHAIILRHAVPTTVDTLLATGIAIPLGVALAVLMTWSETARKAIYPNVIVFQLIPKIALAPLFIVWLGIGSPSRVTFAVFISFFPILVSTTTGLASVSRDLLRLCRSLGASERQTLFSVRFPIALPHLFSGLKVAVTLSIIGVVVGEFIASQEGLGYLILFASSRQQTDLSLACIAVLCAVGLALYGAVVVAERALALWYGDR